MNPVKQVLDLNESSLEENNKIFEEYLETDKKLYVWLFQLKNKTSSNIHSQEFRIQKKHTEPTKLTVSIFYFINLILTNDRR